jgi:hypothetical protein
LDEDSHPYVVFLPSEHKVRILSAIFGSKAAVDILKFSLKQGISKKVYQNELVKRLSYSGKWFALLLAGEKDLSEREKAQILESLFRTYVRWVKDLSAKLNVSKSDLEKAFKEEMK